MNFLLLKVTQDDKQLIIAGIAVPSKDKASTGNTAEHATKQPADEAATDEATKIPYQLLLPELLLSQFNIQIAINNQKQIKSHQITIEQLALRHIKRLLELGERREHAFKDYLIEDGNIDSSRILFCKPQIDSDEGAMPRIAISV